ncbi:MAG: phosphoenolpyruvate carboxykinase [Devosiaceae bacterium]|nr:phosphoenolpyruvate carboxykinase [Devosiaceae bacterium MH13]
MGDGGAACAVQQRIKRNKRVSEQQVSEGLRNPDLGLEAMGLSKWSTARFNLTAPLLYEHAIRNGEAVITAGGALKADTGKHTGRSPLDKFIVRDATTEETIWWGGNQPMEPAAFERLRADMLAHAQGMDLFVQDLYGGADPAHRLTTRVVTEKAWHSLFIRTMLLRPEAEALDSFAPEMTIIDLPSFQADPARHSCRSETVIACDFTRKIVLIAGTHYAGEMKKSVFSMLNFLLPADGVMPMHCSANVDESGRVALFFGLSGTGKTTLSADPERMLIGDDEHGWGPNGVFNFEGGCYAKTINLSAEAEPEIYATTGRFGTVLENVALDPLTREPDFNDASRTQNTRCAYPIDYIPNALLSGQSGQPTNVVMLTCDAFGVLPPLSKMSPDQAMYHFLSGYTAKVAGTEIGVTEPEATFSTCFGAPFMPRHPSVYGDLLRKLIAEHNVQCWLVNTGWSGGAHGTGARMPIKATRRLLHAALDGELDDATFVTDPFFGLAVPTAVEGVDPSILQPRETWANTQAYDEQAQKLAAMFATNFAVYEPYVADAVKQAAPVFLEAAE